MAYSMTGFLIGLVAGAFFTAAVAFPRVGRSFARLASVAMFVGGVGLVAWSMTAMIRGSVMTPFALGGVLISQPAEAIGWGSGLLAGGILALVLSCLGRG